MNDDRYTTFGIDHAAQPDNETALVILERRDGHYEINAVFHWRQLDYAAITQRVKALNEANRPQQIVAEKNGLGSVLIDSWQSEGLPIRAIPFTAETRQFLLDALEQANKDSQLRFNEIAPLRFNWPNTLLVALALALYGQTHRGQRVNFP